MSDPAYQRLVLKLSGEVLAGDKGFGIDPAKANNLAQEMTKLEMSKEAFADDKAQKLTKSEITYEIQIKVIKCKQKCD